MFASEKSVQSSQRSEPTSEKHLSSAPHLCRLLTSPTNVRLGRRGLPRTNTPAYYKDSQITVVKSFVKFGPRLTEDDEVPDLEPGLTFAIS